MFAYLCTFQSHNLRFNEFLFGFCECKKNASEKKGEVIKTIAEIDVENRMPHVQE